MNQIPGHEFWGFVASVAASLPGDVAAFVASKRGGGRADAVPLDRLNQHTINDMGAFSSLSLHSRSINVSALNYALILSRVFVHSCMSVYMA